MNWDILRDPMFLPPFLVGLFCCLSLSLLGPYLFLREERIAPLGISQGIGALAGGGLVFWKIPLPVGAAIGSLILVLLKQIPGAKKDSFWLVLWMVSWAGSLMISNGHPQAEAMHQALLEGELLFSSQEKIITSLILAFTTIVTLAWLHKSILLCELLPSHLKLNPSHRWKGGLVFDLLMVGILAGAVFHLGIMATFALVFFPAWATRTHGRSWATSLAASLFVGFALYCSGFLISLGFDLPFSPILILCLGTGCGVIRFLGKYLGSRKRV